MLGHGSFSNWSWQLLGAVGGASVLTTVAAKLASAAGWFGGPYLVLGSFGVFCIALAILGAYLPRLWTPRSPIARYFGTAAVMVGMSEDIDTGRIEKLRRIKREGLSLAYDIRDSFSIRPVSMSSQL